MNRLIPRLAIAAVVVLGATALGGWTTAPAKPPTSNRDPVVQVYLTRHGETILNALHLVQGWSDSPLTAAGRATATTVGTNLGAEVGQLDAAYSADMVRHYETATRMLQGMGSKLSATRVEGLRELNFGGWEGAKQTAMGAAAFGFLAQQGIPEPTLGQMTDAIKATNPVATLPAENCDEVSDRMRGSLNAIAKDAAKHRDDNILVVSSGLSISCLLVDLGAADRVPETGIANGAVNLLTYKAGAWTVQSVNDTHYATQP
ncbi:histidine phosphatase family protein [Microbacterium sp. NPDC056044]|uniref:histidine phosphatase family protein n=1 Tax=Microbacterium sp. NPDC056044 TaxID=3345690 RepID=UPI0035D82782